jgi:basic membrane lipoprotein Med (substrate-binding protein (PBP1-ABC) superfamily)
MRIKSLIATATMLVALTIPWGCQRASQQPSELHVALVTPGPISDAGWNAAAYDGLDKIGSELAAATAHMEAGSPAQFEESFRDFAQRGSALIFGHGFEFQDAAATVGPEFPDTVFVVTSGLTTADNVGGLVFRLEEAAYLAGVMAAGVSSSGVAGTVGGMEIPPVRLVFDGFKRGFIDARPDGQVKEVFLGNWEDVASARQATLSLIEQGADILIHNADAAGLGVFQACRERAVLALGSNRDQAHVAPDVVLASAVMDIPEAMLRLAKEVRAGTFKGQVYTFDLASGVVDLVINPELADRLSAETRAAVESARSRLLLGQVELQHFGDS